MWPLRDALTRAAVSLIDSSKFASLDCDVTAICGKIKVFLSGWMTQSKWKWSIGHKFYRKLTKHKGDNSKIFCRSEKIWRIDIFFEQIAFSHGTCARPREWRWRQNDAPSPCGFCGRVASSPSNYIFALTSMSLRGFPFCKGWSKVLQKLFSARADWVSDSNEPSIFICLKFLTAGWKVVIEGTKQLWPFGFCVCSGFFDVPHWGQNSSLLTNSFHISGRTSQHTWYSLARSRSDSKST